MKRARIIIAIFGITLLGTTIIYAIMKKELKTEVILRASQERVWGTLTNFDEYSIWNPFITSIEGELKKGNQLTTTMVNGEKKTVFRPVVTHVDKNRSFEWLGQALLGMFKGRHYFILEDMGGGQTKLIHGEKFSGLLSGIILKFIGDDTLRNFQEMNKALKEVVEADSVGIQ